MFVRDCVSFRPLDSKLFLPSRLPTLLSLVDVISVFGDVIGVCRGFLMLFFLQHRHPASPIIVSPPHAPVCTSVSLCRGPSASEGTEEDEFLKICLVVNNIFNQEEDTKLLLTTDRSFQACCALATPQLVMSQQVFSPLQLMENTRCDMKCFIPYGAVQQQFSVIYCGFVL